MICTNCHAWDASDTARFCGHCGICILPIAITLAPNKPAHTQAEPASGDIDVTLTLRPGVRRDVDLRDLSLCLWARPENRLLGRKPLTSSALTARAPEETVEFGSEEISRAGGANTAIEVLVATEQFAGVAPASPFQPRLILDEIAQSFDLIESEVVWRGNMDALEIPIRLSAGAAEVTKAELSLRGRADARSMTAWKAEIQFDWKPDGDRLGIVEPDKPLLLVFNIPAEKKSEFRAMAMPLEADLTITDRHRGSAPELSFRIARGGPPRPRLAISAGPVKALSGRRTRIGLALRNDGGSPFRIEKCEWSMRGPDGDIVREGNETALDLFPALSFACEPGQPILGELAIPLKKGSQTIPQGLYDVEMTLTGPDLEPLQARTTVRVVPSDQPVKGQVCIDFGTTESGAAVAFTSSEWPTPIELGRVTVRTGDEVFDGEFFVPTIAVASYLRSRGLNWLFGNDALAAVNGHGEASAERLLSYDRLKWNLATETQVLLPDNTTRPMLEIAASYIDYLIDRLETHPDVCAIVAKSFITKPAIYRDGQSQLLVHAFQEGRPDFVDWFVNGEDGTPMLLSESWSPLYAVLPRGEDIAAKVFNEDPPLIEDDELEAGANVVVFDVGGGSLDLSLFEVREENIEGKSHRIREMFAATSTSFCGRNFSALIDREIEPVLGGLITDPGGPVMFRELGIRIQKDETIVTADAVANRESLSRLRSFFQSDSGAFSRLAEAGVEFIDTAKFAGEIDERKMVAAIDADLEMRQANAVKAEDRLNIRRLAPQTVLQAVLMGQTGLHSKKLPADDVTLLMARIVAKMEQQYGAELDALIARLVALLPKRKMSVVMITGRGALFPVARALIESRVKQAWPECLRVRADGNYAKWITSVGGAIIGRDNRGDVDIAFDAKVQGVLAVVTGRQSTKSAEYIYADFSPNAIDAGQPVAVVALSRLKRKLRRSDAILEIVKRFEGGVEHETILEIGRAALGDFDADDDWLVLRWQDVGPPITDIVKGSNEQAALQAARR